jgi:hypothetical protein
MLWVVATVLEIPGLEAVLHFLLFDGVAIAVHH